MHLQIKKCITKTLLIFDSQPTFACFPIGLELVAGVTATLVAAQGINADVLTSMLHKLAFVYVQH